jgi:hypothetical protein
MNIKARKEKRAVEYATGDVEVALVAEKNDTAVATVYIPPFIEMPDLIVWDMRYFKLTNRETGGGGYVYSEAFVYHLPPQSEGSE